MNEEQKENMWGLGASKTAVDEPAGEGMEPMLNDSKPSAEYDIVQIAPVERFNVLFKSGTKLRLACWVMLRHKTTGEVVITGAVSPPNGANGRLMLSMDMKNVDKFSPM